MRRHTLHRWLRGYDFARNAYAVWRSDDLMPPDQLLRQTFELCADFAAARRMLETTPVSRPVIYVLVGPTAGERCVIERTETGFDTRENDTSAANDWLPRRPGWEGRIGTRRFQLLWQVWPQLRRRGPPAARRTVPCRSSAHRRHPQQGDGSNSVLRRPGCRLA